jgi:hypothetical protein
VHHCVHVASEFSWECSCGAGALSLCLFKAALQCEPTTVGHLQLSADAVIVYSMAAFLTSVLSTLCLVHGRPI